MAQRRFAEYDDVQAVDPDQDVVVAPPRLERWVEWRCKYCNCHLVDYNVYEPCDLKKDCPRCKKTNDLPRRRAVRP